MSGAADAGAEDPAFFKAGLAALRYGAIPIMALQVGEHAANMADFGVKYDVTDLVEVPAKIVTNNKDSKGKGAFWFEYEVDGETRTSSRMTPSTVVPETMAESLNKQYPAGAAVTAKVNKSYPDFAFVSRGQDREDGKDMALAFAAIDCVTLFVLFRVFRKTGAFKLSSFRK